ncbi:MAG: ParB/RepB/Spo0J family partition protein [Alphaproteobacteria bacterium]|nr:ParB/RepB/Spo0J family partition protein [Alphaproteobacteria bacterium]
MPKNNKRGLGRGIEALFQENKEQNDKNNKKNNIFDNLPIELIKPNPLQPRKSFDKELLEQLADSIKDKGVLQPIIVKEIKGKEKAWQIIAGERRWRAAQIAGLHEIPAHIKNIKDEEVAIIALIENIQRENLSAIDEAKGYKKVMEKFSITHEELSNTMHRSRAYISNFIRLLSLPKDVQKLLEEKKINVGQARPLIGNPNSLSLAKVIISKKLNVRQVEELLKVGSIAKSKNKKELDINILNLEKEIEASSGLKTSIEDKNGKGKITFTYKNLDQLDELIDKIKS